MTIEYVTLGELLRIYLNRKKLPQSDLAKQLYVDPSLVSSWLNDNKIPTTAHLRSMGQILAIPHDLEALREDWDKNPCNIPETLHRHELITLYVDRSELTQADLAQQLHIKPAKIQAWCKNTKQPTQADLQHLAVSLTLSAEDAHKLFQATPLISIPQAILEYILKGKDVPTEEIASFFKTGVFLTVEVIIILGLALVGLFIALTFIVTQFDSIRQIILPPINTPLPTLTATATPSPSPLATPTATPSPVPAVTPTMTVIPTPTPTPSMTPTQVITVTPTRLALVTTLLPPTREAKPPEATDRPVTITPLATRPTLPTPTVTATRQRPDTPPFCDQVTEIPARECQALVALYEATDGPHWTNNSGWLQTTTPCTWFGVKCGDGSVVELVLNSSKGPTNRGTYIDGNGLKGKIPAETGQLTNLTTLNVWGNQLTQLPPEIGHLPNLTYLDVSDNQLTQLPPEIGHLPNLTYLNVWNNQLTQLPPQIGQLTDLTLLGVSDNQLTQLSSQIGQLTNLTSLSVSGNQLTQLPPELWQLTNLTSLFVSGNQLTQLPLQIGQLTNLKNFGVSNNQLTQLPPQIGQLTNLTSLSVSRNQLTQLPSQIGLLTNLTWLDVSHNQLTQLPSQIGQLTNLTWLNVNDNLTLTGPLPETLLSLKLKWFWFENTKLCQPDTPKFAAWWAKIQTFNGKMEICP